MRILTKFLGFGLLLSVVSLGHTKDYDCITKEKLDATLLKDKYRSSNCFSEGLAVVSNEDPVTKERTFGFIDAKGELVIPMQFSYAESFEEGLALVGKNNKSYFIDKAGKTIIDLSHYDSAMSFENGLAVVSKFDKSNNEYLIKKGIIDKQGKLVVPTLYYQFGDINNNQMLASKISDDLTMTVGRITLDNHITIPFNYAYLNEFKNGLAVAVKYCDMSPVPKKNSNKNTCRYGVIDEKNATIIPFDYEFISEFDDEGNVLAMKNNLWGKLNSQGKVIVAFNSSNQKALEKAFITNIK